ncbi:hypothetical protein C8F01DRAFT_953349, partial [Mycena amicta]
AAGCATGAFYQAPSLGSSVDSMTPLDIVWKPTLNCLQPAPSLVDIYLDNPGAASPRIHLWQGVPYADGNYTATMLPRWWNSTDTANLQIMVVPNGVPPFLSTIPAGPVFQATYTSNGTTPAAADTTITGDSTTIVTVTAVSGVSSHNLSSGKKAAAVLLPLLFVILLGLAYVKISRARGAAKRGEWSEKLDKRMSTISADWKSITAGGAKEAVRQSMAQRNSTAFSFGSIRTPNVEGDPVIMGEKPLPIPRGSLDVNEEDLPRTSLGTGVGVRRPRNPSNASPPDRSSRAVSFADAAHPRPSLSSAYSRGSRAFHVGSTYGDIDGQEAPPVPALPSPSRISATTFDAPPEMTSPRQTAGPLTLTPDDIRRRMTTQHGANGEGAWRQSVDEVFGALSMMRTGGPGAPDDTQDDAGEYLFAPTPETVFAYPGTPAASSFNSVPSSPFAMPMSLEPMANSPDAMLRAYAAKHAS